MSDKTDPVLPWSSELRKLRARLLKRDSSCPGPTAELIDAALGQCDLLLRELAGAYFERDRLTQEVAAEKAGWRRLLDVCPTPCLITDAAGLIRYANRPAALLLSVSAQGLAGRQLLLFSRDRAAFGMVLSRMQGGSDHVRGKMIIQPRERKSTEVEFLVVPRLPEDPASWLWFVWQARQESPLQRQEAHALQPDISCAD